MSRLRIGSLFSGCGGLDLGFEYAGFETKWFCEIDKWCNKILTKNWPEIPIHGDVNELREVEPIDILIGGFPCQPVSQAGKKLAEEDPRWLWPGFNKAIGLLRPKIVVVENVPGLRKRGFETVVSDLAERGYNIQWLSLRSSDIGAPHRRERIFIIANSIVGREHEADEGNQQLQQLGSVDSIVANSSGARAGWNSGEILGKKEQGWWYTHGTNTLKFGVTTAPYSYEELLHRQLEGGARRWTESSVSTSSNATSERSQGEESEERFDVSTGSAITDSDSGGCEVSGEQDSKREDKCGDNPDGLIGTGQEWGKYEGAIRRWENLFELAPDPRTDQGRLSPNFVEWMMGYPQDWTDGVSRTQRLKMLGNSVQVQCAYSVATIVKSLADFSQA